MNATPESQTGVLGDVLTYNINLTNNGTVPDIIVVDNVTDVPAGWAVDLIDADVAHALPYSTPLLASKTSYLNLTLAVHIPLNATAGTNTMCINIHSCADPTECDNATVSVNVSLVPIPEQPQFFKEESSVQGIGYVAIDKKVQDWNAAIDVEEHMKGFGEFSMDSKEILDESARRSDPTDPNYYNQKLINFEGNNTNRLTSFAKYESPAFYGGTGAKVRESFNVSEIQKQEFGSIKTNSALGTAQSLDFETMDEFSGIWSTHSDWQKICQKEIAHHQMFMGNFSVQKDLKFEREVVIP